MASINYDDTRFTELEKDKQAAIDNSNATYDGLIGESSQHYDNLINQSKEWADKQAEIQNQQTQFTVEKIEQQKQEAEKDYTKEQKGAYQDYMKNINPYGSASRSMVEQGLSSSGASRTEQMGYYNLYQQRYLQARESYNEIIMNYNNNIKEAELQNNSALAEIYANANKEQLELALQQYSVIADLKLNKLNTSLQLDNTYHDRWRDIETQINTENALAEEIRQYNKSLEEEKRQFNAQLEEEKRQYNKSYNLQKQQVSASDPDYTDGEIRVYTDYTGKNGLPINSDVQYGTFNTKDKNGVKYQPNNVAGDYLKSSGQTAGEMYGKDVVNSSGVNIANQKVWKTEKSEKYYIWNGSTQKYDEVPAPASKTSGAGRNF